MKKLFVTFFGTLILATSAYSMGGDKPGPNGGYITMPSAYHVELVPKDSAFLIYLHDINFKNAITSNSSASIIFIPKNQKSVTIKMKCIADKQFFSCKIPNDKIDNYKEIQVESKRKNIFGKNSIYKLPLKFE
ncbi:MAG: hypothetical protein Q7U04_09870 [Bacteriovorax sp.]|nr:hypothetical protein [Bacteriovorax sp.]